MGVLARDAVGGGGDDGVRRSGVSGAMQMFVRVERWMGSSFVGRVMGSVEVCDSREVRRRSWTVRVRVGVCQEFL